MTSHTYLRVLLAALGIGALIGMGALAVTHDSAGAQIVVVAPASGPLPADDPTDAETTPTTSTVASFRPTVTASIPPPP